MRFIDWLKKVLRLGNGYLQIARVMDTGRCDYCNTPVSRDLIDDDSVTLVCTNPKCGHRYEITGLSDIPQ